MAEYVVQAAYHTMLYEAKAVFAISKFKYDVRSHMKTRVVFILSAYFSSRYKTIENQVLTIPTLNQQVAAPNENACLVLM